MDRKGAFTKTLLVVTLIIGFSIFATLGSALIVTDKAEYVLGDTVSIDLIDHDLAAGELSISFDGQTIKYYGDQTPITFRPIVAGEHRVSYVNTSMQEEITFNVRPKEFASSGEEQNSMLTTNGSKPLQTSKKHYDLGEPVHIYIWENVSDVRVRHERKVFGYFGQNREILFLPDTAGRYVIEGKIGNRIVQETFTVGFFADETNPIHEPRVNTSTYPPLDKDHSLLKKKLSQRKYFTPDEEVKLQFDLAEDASPRIEAVNLKKIGDKQIDVDQVMLEGRAYGADSELAEAFLLEVNETSRTFEASFTPRRSMQPGEYVLEMVMMQGDEEITVIEEEFLWGLVSMNTKKSIYKPGETAEFEIVVLDAQGRGVCDVPILLNLTEPNGDINTLSSFNNDIIGREQCGLYDAKFLTSEEGEHVIDLVALMEDNDDQHLYFETSFMVREKYAYDIIRRTPSMIDPTILNDFHVEIDITPYTSGDDELVIYEYVPSVFSIYNTSASIEEREDVKVLSWKVPSRQTTVSYNYAVPLIWPYLYALGPLQVNGFNEFRPWYVAVDPIIEANGNPAVDVAVTAVNNTSFIIAWIDTVDNDASFRIYYANGTPTTGVVDVDTSVDDESHIAVNMINESVFLIAWIDGPADDVTYAIYSIDGTLDAGPTDAETAVGGPANDVSIAIFDNNFALCYVDDAEADADVRIISYATLGAGTEVNIDGNIAPDTANAQLLDCVTVNASMFTSFRHDDPPHDSTLRRSRETGANIGQVDFDTDVGDSGMVAISSITSNTRYVGVWHDISGADANDVQIEIRDGTNSLVLADTSVDTDAGATSRVGAATVQNRSKATESFLVAWNDRTANDIRAAVYSDGGVLEAGPYQLVDDENTTSLLFDVFGINSFTGIGVCDGTFVLGYTNASGSVVAETFNIDGTEWTGTCDFDNPEWSNELESPTDPATYQLGQNYTFNVTWTDPTTSISTVLIQQNLTAGGAFTNLTVNQSNGDEYFYTFINLVPGTYSWLMIANDSADPGNQNQTDLFTYTIDQAQSTVNLSLNSTDDNITVEVLSTVNLSGAILSGEGDITLYLESAIINGGASPIENFTLFDTLGTFNVTLEHAATQNYTLGVETHFVIIQDTTIPLWEDRNQSTNLTGPGKTVALFTNISDNYALDSVWLGTNESGVWVNYTSRKAGLTMQDFTAADNVYTADISAVSSLSLVVGEGFVRDAINLSYNYDSGFADDTFDVVINTTTVNLSQYQNISYYVRSDVASRHRTSILVVSSGTACNPTTPITLTSTSFEVVTFNVEDISGGCTLSAIDQFRLRFSDDNDVTSAVGNITLDELYLTNDSLSNTFINFTWRNASITDGSATWIIYFNDTSGNENSTTSLTFLIQDIEAPQWSNNTTSPESPIVYSPLRNYTFNVSWTDDINVDTVLIQHNFTTGGGLINTTVNATDGNVYFYTFGDLGAGEYSWMMIANDTSNNLNQTDLFGFTISLNQSVVNLSLDSTDGNVSVEANTFVNLSGARITGESDIILYNEGEVINEASAVENITLFNVTGTFNITLEHPASQNYSRAVETHYVIVNDTIFPEITLQSPPDNNVSLDANIVFNATVNDSLEIANVSLWADFSGTFQREQTNSSGINAIDYLFNETRPDGVYLWGIQACDTNNNCNFSENRTLTIDAHAPEWQNANQSSNTTGQGDTVSLFANFSDNLTLQAVWLGTNESGDWVNYTPRKPGLTLQDFTDVESDTYVDEISASASISNVIEGYVRDAINLSYNYDSGAADDTFDVIVNTTDLNISHYQNISYYVKADVASRHRTSLLVISSGTACNPTTPVTLTSTGFTLVTFNVADLTGSCDRSAIDQFRLRFSDDNDLTSATGDITLDELFLTNDSLSSVFVNFTWRNASISGGSVTWKIYMNDSAGNENATDDITFFIQDVVFPTWFDNRTDPDSPITYAIGQNYTFNVSWSDNVAVDTVVLQHNFSGGALVNVTVNTTQGDDYIYTFSHRVPGVYSWMMAGNDTSGNLNQTDLYTYTINQNQSVVNLSLESTDGNVTVEVNSVVNLSGRRLTGQNDITLINNDSIINSGAGPLENLTLFDVIGTFNITLEHPETTNFSRAVETHYVIVQDTIAPNVTLNSPNDGNNSSVQRMLFNATIDDNYIIENVSLFGDFSGSYGLNQTNTSGLKTIDYVFNISSLPDGSYTWSIQACDTSGNCNFAPNRSLLIDTITPQIAFGLGTPTSGSEITQDNIYVNVTVNETNEENITFNLFNSSHDVINSTTFFTAERTINFTGLEDGLYFFNVTVIDDADHENSTETRNVTTNFRPPQWSNNVTSPPPPITYTPLRNYTFNVTWTDALGVDTVFIQHNFTSNGAMINTTVNATDGDVYFYTFSDLRAGVYSWMMVANDTSNNLNQTDLYVYTVDRNQSVVNLSLDDTDNNITVEVHSTVNITGYRLVGEANITLFNQGGSMNTGPGPLENLTLFNVTGSYNITLEHPLTQNYSRGLETHFITVQDTILPNITLNSPNDGNNSSSSNIFFNATIDDNYIIQNVSLFTNTTGSFAINQTNTSGLKTIDYLFNVTSIPDGRYRWAIQACDTEGNCNISLNRTFTVDTTPPSITESETNITVGQVNANVRINCTATDAIMGNDTFLIEAEKPTLPNENYTTTFLTGNTYYADVQLVEAGTWTFTCHVNDTLNNLASRHSGNVTASDAVNAPTVPVLQGPLDGVNISVIGQFNWSNSTDPDSDPIIYILEIDNDSDFSSPEYYNGSIAETDDPTEDTTVSLSDDGVYYWHVRASDGTQNSSFSNVSVFTFDREAPSVELSAPANNSVLTSGDVSFTFNASDNLNFWLRCNLTINGVVNVSEIAANNSLITSVDVTGFNSANFSWNVTCRDAIFVNTSTTYNFTMYRVNAPIEVNASMNNDNSSVDLLWRVGQDAATYNIYITDNLSAGFPSTANFTGLIETNFTDPNAGSFGKRFYHVSAVNGPAENFSNITIGKIDSINWIQGFNLISWPTNVTPLVLNNGTNGGFNPPTDPPNCLLSIFRYNGSRFEETVNDLGSWTPAIGSESFTQLDPARGYWFETNSTCNMTFVGSILEVNMSLQLNNTFTVVGWFSAFSPQLGQESVVGNPLHVEPTNSIADIFRYNTTGTTSGEFQGIHHFPGFGWWPFFGDDDFTTIESGKGYYFNVPNPQANWTHNPNFE